MTAIRDATPGDFAAILALNDESVHVLSPLDAQRLAALHRSAAYHKVVDAGGCFIIPGHTPHWGRATEDVVLTRLGNGPRDIFYFDKK